MKKIIFICLILAVGGSAFYFLYPPQAQGWAIDSKITIKFDKPVKRQEISHIIAPKFWESGLLRTL